MGRCIIFGRYGVVNIRLAEEADARQLAVLNQTFNDSTVTAEQIAVYLGNCPSQERTIVADDDGLLIGFACLQIYSSWCYPDPWAEVTEMYVMPEYQRRGIGRALVSFLEVFAREASVTDIVLLTGKRNVAGQGLYRSCGYLEQEKCPFQKALL